MSRHVQLPKKGVPPLLKTINKNNPQFDMKKSVKEPENIDDPPIEDTASEDEHQHSPLHQFVDSSDDDVSFGNIQRTTFKPKTVSNATIATGNGRQSAAKKQGSAVMAGKISERRSARQIGAKKRTKDDVDDDDDDADGHDLFGSKRTKINSAELASKVGDHMSSERMSSSKRPAIQRGYGRKSQTSDPQAKFRIKRHISDSTSPEKKPKFKSRNFSPVNSSPVSNLKLSQPFNAEDGESSPLSEAPSSEERSDPPRALDNRNKKQKPTRRPKRKDKNKVKEFSPDPVSHKPQFKMPDSYNDYAPSAKLVNLDATMDDSPAEKPRQLDPGMALCPMCDDQVDEELLKEFSNGERMRLSRQAKFCRMHKQVSAKKTWEEKGYPMVDWANLEARIEGHHDLLESLIMGSGSHFGDLLKENIRTGQARTLLTTDEYLTPGYYGLRGMSVMTEAVVAMFSNLLRKRAPVDMRVSGRGYTGFVQSVLVPELAVKLIQEDLHLGEDQAREVMEESRAVGEILNDEKRQSQSQAHLQMHDESQDKGDEDAEERNTYSSDDDAPVELKIEQAADSVSDLSSPSSYSQRSASVKAQSQEAHDSDSDESLKSLGGRMTKRDQASVEKQDVTILPSRSSPRSRNLQDVAPVTLEVDDSDDASSLVSF